MFPISFVLPVTLAGWYLGRWPALAVATGLVGTRLTMVIAWDVQQFTTPVAIANALIRLIVLALLGYLVNKTAQQQRALSARLASLEGLLPICSACRKIRAEDGTWETVEEFISARSEARFTPGQCEPCGRLYQPGAFTREE